LQVLDTGLEKELGLLSEGATPHRVRRIFGSQMQYAALTDILGWPCFGRNFDPVEYTSIGHLMLQHPCSIMQQARSRIAVHVIDIVLVGFQVEIFAENL
jgi:hypothetical protein